LSAVWIVWRDPGGAGHQRDPATAQRSRLGGQHDPALPLVKVWQHHRELLGKDFLVGLHQGSVGATAHLVQVI